MDVIDIGSRRELFVDDHLIAETDAVTRRLHDPTPEEIVLTHDDPWEGNTSVFHTIFEDNDRYRMYYRGSDMARGEEYIAYAESRNGLDWYKPELKKYELCGTTENNVVFGPDGIGGNHNLTPFKDPAATEDDAQYKAVGSGEDGLLAFKSSDGFEWSRISDDPIFTREQGAFDSQNLAFWDNRRSEYRAYFRYFHEVGDDRRRGIKTATSDDFVKWSDPVPLEYVDDRNIQLYTNAVQPYYRAPHIFLGLPVRYVERNSDTASMRQLPGWDELRESLIENHGRTGYALTDLLFMTSRDGETFERSDQAFLKPGLWSRDSTAQWYYGDNFPAWQLIETPSREPGKPRELSLFTTEGYRADASCLRRYSLRIDGFASLQAGGDTGMILTKPLRFEGDEFALNYSTSAAGRIRVGLVQPDGSSYPGFSVANSAELFGDDLVRVVSWTTDRNVEELSGEPVRIRFELTEADVFSFTFR